MAKNQGARQLSIFAAVFALHIAVVWALLATTQPVMRFSSPNLQLVFIAPTSVVAERPARKAAPGSSRQSPKSTPAPAVELHPRAASEEGSLIRPPIDWEDELDRAVRNSIAASPSTQPRDFGFPHSSGAPSSSPLEFGWSYAPTHRVQSLPGGGLLVNLNDNCVLVFAPLPFFACAVGKKPTNGDLFKHMNDPSQRGGWGVP